MPVHVTPLLVNVATTLNVDEIGVMPGFVAIKDGTLPVPESGANPIAPAVLLQENTAPGTLLVNTTEGTVAPAQ